MPGPAGPEVDGRAAGPLDGRAILRLACAEAMKDGAVQPEETRFLEELRALLRVPAGTLATLVEEARAEGGKPGKGGLSSPKVFGDACLLAWADGEIQDSEVRILERFGTLLGLEAPTVQQILTLAKPMARSGPAVKGVEMDAATTARLAAAGPPPLPGARDQEPEHDVPGFPPQLVGLLLGLALGGAVLIAFWLTQS